MLQNKETKRCKPADNKKITKLEYEESKKINPMLWNGSNKF